MLLSDVLCFSPLHCHILLHLAGVCDVYNLFSLHVSLSRFVVETLHSIV